jgi:hypothetical protein
MRTFEHGTHAGSPKHVFVIGAFVYILKSSPSADVVNKQCEKISAFVFYVRH